MEYLWKWFLRMSKRRGGGFGPAPLAHQAMESFFRLARIAPTPWEVELLEKLDDIYLTACTEEEKRQAKNRKKKQKTPPGKEEN